MNRGKLIVFEGISGTGKDTQGKLLVEYLSSKKIITQFITHPSSDMRTILSTWLKVRKIDDLTAVYLLLADRYDRVRQLINPTLSQGEWIISSRSWLTALIYQGQKPEVAQFIKDQFSRFEPKPDLILYFDIKPETAYTRLTKRIEVTQEKGYYEELDKLKKIRQRHQEVLSQFSHEKIDAGKTIDEVAAQIRQKVSILL